MRGSRTQGRQKKGGWGESRKWLSGVAEKDGLSFTRKSGGYQMQQDRFRRKSPQEGVQSFVRESQRFPIDIDAVANVLEKSGGTLLDDVLHA